MRTPLTVAIGVLVVAGVAVGVTSVRAASEDPTPVQPIRVEAPAAVDPAAPAPPQAPAAPPDAPRDPNGYVAPPPAVDDDDDGPDDDLDDD